MSVSLV